MLLGQVPGLQVIAILCPMASGFFAVHLYRLRSGQQLSPASGAHLGWISGVFGFLITVLIFTAFVVMLTTPEFADAIRQQAIPGAVVLVAKDGKVAYEKSYGYLTYDSTEAVYPETIYDLASVTKIMATTVSVMKLYDEGKIDLQKTLGDYLPWVKGSNKKG